MSKKQLRRDKLVLFIKFEGNWIEWKEWRYSMYSVVASEEWKKKLEKKGEKVKIERITKL